MIGRLNGKLVEKSPTELLIECGGVGYEVKISLNTFTSLSDNEQIKIFTKLIVREDANILYGFQSKEEREMFNQLISVSGIGPNTAMIMLSSLNPYEIASAIQNEEVNIIQSVKGIGAKTAQRVIVDLKGKSTLVEASTQNLSEKSNTIHFDALTALVSLGFDKRAAERALKKASDEVSTVEGLIKEALKVL